MITMRLLTAVPLEEFTMGAVVKLFASILALSSLIVVSGCNEEVHKPTPAPDVTVSVPIKRDVTKYLTYTGSTAPLERVEVRARVQGYLQEIKFTPKSQVQAGEVLFVIDPDPFKAKVAQAQATLDARKASLDLAQVEYEKARSLEAKDAVSKIKLIEQTAKRDVAKAEVEQAQADLDAANIELRYTDVKSPINGQVGRNLVDVGNLIGADKTPLTTIVNDRSVYVYFSVSEHDVLSLTRKYLKDGKIAAPDDGEIPAYMGLADEKGYPHQGKIDFADVELDASTGTMQVRGVFPNTEGLYAAGMFVRIRVPIEKGMKLLVPDTAVQADQEGRYLLVVAKDDMVEQRRVRVGQDEDGLRVIEEGLTDKDRVVVNGMRRARPGTKVKPIQAEKATAPASATEPKPGGGQ
jgi:membrane fusion protein, multidrug efflux system